VTDEAELREQIALAKRQGYAIEDEQCDLGTRCIAAPIYNGEGRIVAALGVAGPRVRIRKSQFSKMALLVINAAERISERLGYRHMPRIDH
jgi:DNA-binding IclR family transcriptional regulator